MAENKVLQMRDCFPFLNREKCLLKLNETSLPIILRLQVITDVLKIEKRAVVNNLLKVESVGGIACYIRISYC
jgi:hypothetical protein